MNPYRADHRARLNADPVPVVVIDSYVLPGMVAPHGDVSWPSHWLLAITQDGRHIADSVTAFTCTEPGYVGRAPEFGEHEHEFPTSGGEAVLEGARMVGLARRCTLPGCDAVTVIPLGSAAKMPGLG